MPLETIRKSWPVAATLRFTYQLLVAAHWVWDTLLRPVSRPLTRVGKWLVSRYMRLWDRVVYTKEGYFSKVRAGVMLASTIAFLWVLPHVLLFAAQAGLFLATVQKETIFLTQAQEIVPDEDIHSVRGCESEVCDADNSVYFRVRPTGFHQVWSLLTRGSIFLPDYVTSPVAPGLNRCEVVSYGFRAKFLMRNWDVYPDLLSARCSFVKGDGK